MRMWRRAGAVMAVLALASSLVVAGTPGEEAVKSAIKTLKEKRGQAKDAGDQALLDAVIKDAEERLAQVGQGEPEPEAMKADEPFAMPKGWELKFNTGRNRPTYDPKTKELKLTYDFSDPKQLSDFEPDEKSQSGVKKGVLTVERRERLQHVVKYAAINVSVDLFAMERAVHIQTDGGLTFETATTNHPRAFALRFGRDHIAMEDTATPTVRQPVAVRDLFLNDKRCGVTVNGVKASGAIKDGKAGHLVLTAGPAANQFSKLTIRGTLDPEWVKEFFAGKQ